MARFWLRSAILLYRFEDFVLDTDRRELRRGPQLAAIPPQVFDLLEYLIKNRNRVVSRLSGVKRPHLDGDPA